MDITDIISIVLGSISILLAWRYKKFGDEFEKDQDQIIRAIHDNSVYSAVEIRHMKEMIAAGTNLLNLHKDKLYVYKTSKYRACNLSEIIDKLNKELPKILKQKCIYSIMGTLNLQNEDIEIIGIVTLKYQFEKEDLNKINDLNDIFSEDGIRFEIKMI